MAKRILFSAVATVVLLAAAALVWAPYLPRLLGEGFPAAVWPAAGSFADVAGSGRAYADAPSPPRLSTFDPQLRELLSAHEQRRSSFPKTERLRWSTTSDGNAADTLFNSYSLVKSLIGALVLKALSEGRIESLDDPLGTYLPGTGDTALRVVPLMAFLEMRSGVQFEAGTAKSLSGAPVKDLEASFANPFGPLVRLHMQGLEKVAGGLTSNPNVLGQFSYQNINTAILGSVLEKAYGEPLQNILSSKIWQPSGAAAAKWRRYRQDGGVTAYCCLYATARDWVKVAWFLSRNGSADSPFLPWELWRGLMGARFTDTELREGQYGRHVRHDILDREGQELQGRFTYFLGRGGQIVYLMPERNLVVVRFGEGLQLLHSTLYATWRTLHPGE